MKHKKTSKTHTRITIQLPQELFDHLHVLNKASDTDFKEDIIARMALSLELNDTLMATDRLRRLIFCKQLSYEYQKKRNKG